MSGSITISDFSLDKELILEKSLSFFAERFPFAVKIGVELEFYVDFGGVVLRDQENSCCNSELDLDSVTLRFVSILNHHFQNDDSVYLVEKEKGAHQIEIKFCPTSNLLFLAKKINDVKAEISEIAVKQGFFADFCAQKFVDDCGSAMQFNLSCHDNAGNNLFCTDLNLVKKITASILKYANQMMIFCVQNQEDFLRFDIELNKNLHKKGKFVAPTFVCCGFDNRSALVRFFALNSKNAGRVEFRLSGANCDANLILASLLFTLLQNVEFDENLLVYGNAFDGKYNLEKLPQSRDEALGMFLGGELFKFLSNFSNSDAK